MTFEQMLEACQNCWIAHGMEEGQNGCQKCSRSIGRQGAKFSLEGAPGPHIVIDVDRIDSLSNEQRCDYIFIAGRTSGEVRWIASVEITAGRGKEPDDVWGQLQAGAKFAEHTFGPAKGTNFRPVLVGRVRGGQRKLRKKIKYSNDWYVIETISNGGKLVDAWKEAQ